MQNYTGVFWLVSIAPVWAIALVVLMVAFGIPFIIADRATGLFYNFSYSGMVGDLLLTVAIIMGATVVQRGEPLPSWFAGALPQLFLFAVCVVVAIYFSTAETPLPLDALPDRYHNAVTIPFLLFLVLMLGAATLANGTTVERVAVVLLVICGWGGLVFYDAKTDRLNQPQRLEQKFGLKLEHGRYVRPPPAR